MRIAKYGEPDYAIHMPILLCEPLAGDYDGDLVTTFGPLTLWISGTSYYYKENQKFIHTYIYFMY